jgi:glycosyltransferase involved in cell wall biosynthesis
MSRPVLTIAVPTYNRAALLDLCLGRIIEQVRPYGDMVEVLVSNNAATDHTKDVIAKY